MPRPRNKQDLLKAGEEYYTKLIEMADGMSEKEMNTEFDFSGDPSKKERHSCQNHTLGRLTAI